MTQMHIMLDLETWGTTPGSDIRSIGACVFDPGRGTVADAAAGGKQFTQSFYIACHNPIVGGADTGHYDEETERYHRYPLTRNPKTVQWWSEQSDVAKAAFTDAVDLADGLCRFGRWLEQVSGAITLPPSDLRLWSHGANFDPPILAAAYEACGLPVPWHYRAPRDTRTIFEAAGMDPHRCLAEFTTGTHHHALDDAICQARAVCAAYKALGIDEPSKAALVAPRGEAMRLTVGQRSALHRLHLAHGRGEAMRVHETTGSSLLERGLVERTAAWTKFRLSAKGLAWCNGEPV